MAKRHRQEARQGGEKAAQDDEDGRQDGRWKIGHQPQEAHGQAGQKTRQDGSKARPKPAQARNVPATANTIMIPIKSGRRSADPANPLGLSIPAMPFGYGRDSIMNALVVMLILFALLERRYFLSADQGAAAGADGAGDDAEQIGGARSTPAADHYRSAAPVPRSISPPARRETRRAARCLSGR